MPFKLAVSEQLKIGPLQPERVIILNQYNMLNAHDIQQVIDLGDKLASCRDLDLFRDELLGDITRFLGAETGTLLTFSTREKMNIGFNCSYGVSSKMHKDYVNGFFEKDPAVALLFDTQSKYYLDCPNSSKVISLENHVDYDHFTAGFFYNAFLRPLDIHHLILMKIALRPDEDNDLLIGIHRPEKKGSFSEKDLAKAKLLIPTLTGAMGNLTSRALLHERQTIIQSLGEDMHDCGLMIVNDRMDILHQSTLFRHHFGQKGQDISSASLPPQIFQACQKMKNEFSKIAAQNRQMNEHSLHQKIFFKGNNLTCNIKAITADNGLRFIIYSSEKNRFKVNEKVMERSHLTERQKDIACQITLGLTNIQIAEKLGISIRTVENHLCAIYAKVKVQNRTSLTNVLSQGFFR